MKDTKGDNMSSNENSSKGIGFIGLLTIMLIGLKLTNFINISWLMVFLPTIIYTLGSVLVFIIVVITYALIKK